MVSIRIDTLSLDDMPSFSHNSPQTAHNPEITLKREKMNFQAFTQMPQSKMPSSSAIRKQFLRIIGKAC